VDAAGRNKTVRELVQSLMDGFLGVGCVFKRLDTGEGNYLRELQVRLSLPRCSVSVYAYV
jgi:hypothetical protein